MKKRIPPNLEPWFEARRIFRLTDAQIAMARELGLNPRKFGGLANHRQEPWKVPLPEFIEQLYVKRFGESKVVNAQSLESVVSRIARKKEAKKAKKAEKAKLAVVAEGTSQDG